MDTVYSFQGVSTKSGQDQTAGLSGRVESTQRPPATLEPVPPDEPVPRIARRRPVSLWFGASATFYW